MDSMEKIRTGEEFLGGKQGGSRNLITDTNARRGDVVSCIWQERRRAPESTDKILRGKENKGPGA